MTSSVDVIVLARRGGRPLLQTADSLRRQRTSPLSIAVIKEEALASPPLLDSVASRLSAIVFQGSANPAVALNAAVRTGSGSIFVVLPAGFILADTFVERCELALRGVAADAVAPSVAYRTADGLGELIWMPERLSPIEVLSEIQNVPPVFAVRRDGWMSLGGFDEALRGLVEYEFWLRLASTGRRAVPLREPLIVRQAGEQPEALDNNLLIEYFQSVLERNRAVVDRNLQELLISREIRFGQLQTRHREQLLRRDEELAELDRLRAEAAHHRAYLRHHGRDEFDWGDLRRTDPVSRDWGYDRGVPVDRRYIEAFLDAHCSDIQGAVLEVQEDDFTLAAGGRRVTRHDVLDIDASNQRATVLADLRLAPEIGSETYDCIILTQTLHVIDDIGAALRESYRILKPGGVLLATFPAASRVCLEYGEDGDYWRMTPAGARALFRSSFEPATIVTQAYGNVLTNAAFLYGMGSAELTDREFEAHDPYFPAVTGVRAKKTEPATRDAARGIVLLYHRIDATPDIHTLGIPPEIFDAQLRWLRSECQLVPLDDLLSNRIEDLSDRTVALTFDDGYEDNLRVAIPLLQRYQIPATFFLTTCGLAEPTEYWWDTLERLLLQSGTPASLDLTGAGLPVDLPTRNMDERQVAHLRLHEMLVHAPLRQRDASMRWLSAWAGPGTPRVRPMVADEVKELAQLPGVTIGAHTVNHVSLPDNADSRVVEISDCQVELRRVTGQRIELFAYPYGAVDGETAAMVRRGWRWGLSCDERVLADSFDAARVPRLDVKAWSQEEFAARVLRLFDGYGAV